MDYSTDYNYVSPVTDNVNTSASIPLVFLLVYVALVVFAVVTMWKVYTKAGKPGWASIVPIYNAIVELQIVGRPVWWILLFFVPFANIVVAIIIVNDLAKSFGKTVAWTVGLIFLPFIFYPMLAFGSAKYVGPAAAAK